MKPMKRRRGPHEVLAKLVSQVGEKQAGDERLGVPEVAAFLDIAPGTLYKLLDPDQGGDLSYARARQISERYGATAAAEDMAQAAGGVFVPLASDGKPETHWHRSQREIIGDAAALAQKLSLALEDDNDIDKGEVGALKMLETVNALISEAVTVRLALKQVIEGEGATVVPLAKAGAR